MRLFAVDDHGHHIELNERVEAMATLIVNNTSLICSQDIVRVNLEARGAKIYGTVFPAHHMGLMNQELSTA